MVDINSRTPSKQRGQGGDGGTRIYDLTTDVVEGICEVQQETSVSFIGKTRHQMRSGMDSCLTLFPVTYTQLQRVKKQKDWQVHEGGKAP